VLFICAGLSALAVGIGALFPNLREDNPSKIVSGFGGTLNLVLSILFLVLIVALTAVPYHAAQMGRKIGIGAPPQMFALGMVLAVLLTVAAVILPLWMGVAAFERMET